jgi:hypothetical protein
MVALFGEGEFEGFATNRDCTQQRKRTCILVGQIALSPGITLAKPSFLNLCAAEDIWIS